MHNTLRKFWRRPAERGIRRNVGTAGHHSRRRARRATDQRRISRSGRFRGREVTLDGRGAAGWEKV